MPHTTHMPTPEDDGRHTPGPDALPLWNESYWFPFYDPAREIGVVLRAGVVPNQREANLFLFLTHQGAVVHSVVNLRAALPAAEPRRLAVGDFVMEWERPLERFRLRYAHGGHAMDVVWEGYSPAYLYPRPPDTSADLIPGHVEQGGRVTGTVTLAGTAHRIDCLGHRDHTWGGERDWAKFHSWDYLSGEIDEGWWFHAVRVAFAPGADIFVGCLWDGRELHALSDIAIEVATTDGGTRQTGVDVRFTDERGRAHRVVGEEVLVIAPVQFGRTWLRDGITRYRYGDRVGYGILEHGYVEPR